MGAGHLVVTPTPIDTEDHVERFLDSTDKFLRFRGA